MAYRVFLRSDDVQPLLFDEDVRLIEEGEHYVFLLEDGTEVHRLPVNDVLGVEEIGPLQ